MSGVEVVFGVVTGGASLVSLAIQLGESAAKLKRIYNAAKNAPRTIERLVFSLETMSLALRELERRRQRDNDSGIILERCIMECRQRTAEIRQMIDSMECYMSNCRLSGKVYAAFKERDMKDLLNDLERAKSSLELAYMMSLSAEQMRRDQAHHNLLTLHGTLLRGLQADVSASNADISQQLRLLHQPSTPPERSQLVTSNAHPTTANKTVLTNFHNIGTSEISTGHEHTNQCGSPVPARPLKRRNSKVRLRVGFSLPVWLCSRIWDFTLTATQCGWGTHLRTYNVVPENSLIFYYCRSGNVAGVQRLIRNGEGTPLDVFYAEGGKIRLTLIEVAALNQRHELCRYLLSQTTWPDHAMTLSKSLDNFIFCGPRGRVTEIYRLFIEDPGFDADLDDAKTFYPWLRHCENTECVNLILENQFPGFFSLPVEARFKLVIQAGIARFMKPSSFLKYVGLQQSDQRLASLKTDNGRTVLHYTARRLFRLWNLAYRKFPCDDLQGWIDLGASVLKLGADPSRIAAKEDFVPVYAGKHGVCFHDFRGYRQKGWLTTPLLDYLNVEHWEISLESEFMVRMTLKAICIWAKMIQQAGLKLRHYGAKEEQAWINLGFHNIFKVEQRESHFGSAVTRLERLIYGSTPADWSLMIRYSSHIPVYKLRPLPGTFTEERHLPTTILWCPTENETNEGPWELVENRELVTNPIDLRDLDVQSEEPFTELVHRTQDDSGVIMLIQYRAARVRGSASRSRSQPPYMRHRKKAYFPEQGRIRRSHIWLETCHLCSFDSKWRLNCMKEQDEPYGSHVRNCFKGISSTCLSVQESWAWNSFSFLADIADCQDSMNPSNRFHRQRPESMRHTGDRKCPQRCCKVQLDRLPVPEPLRRFHPKRRYAEAEWIGYDNDG